MAQKSKTDRTFSGTIHWTVQSSSGRDRHHDQTVKAEVYLVDGRLNYLVYIGKDDATSSTKTRSKALPREHHMVAAIQAMAQQLITKRHRRSTAIRFGTFELS